MRGRRAWHEPHIEKSIPEPAPGGPVVTPRHHIDTFRGQRRGHQTVAATEPILAPKPEVYGQGAGAQGTDEAPDAPLIVVLGKLFREPAFEAVGTLDLGDDQVTAEIGRKEAQTGELARVPFGVAERQVPPERDAAHPHGAPEGVCRQEDLFPQPPEDAPVAHLLQLKPREYHIDLERAIADGTHEPMPYEVRGLGIGGGQQQYADRGSAARVHGLDEGRDHRKAACGVVRGAGGASIAANSSARSVPGATVDPRSASTGTLEKASTPNAMTVARLATRSDASVSGSDPSAGRMPARSKNRA